MLSESGVSVAYCSDAVRTQQTLAPLRSLLGDALHIQEVSAAAPGGREAHIATIVTAVGALPEGTRAVVVSHSDTVGPIIERLGGGIISPIAEAEFDRMLVLLGAPGGSKTLLKLRY